jgi:hypothetical protein
MTPEIVDSLKVHKPALLARLGERTDLDRPPDSEPTRPAGPDGWGPPPADRSWRPPVVPDRPPGLGLPVYGLTARGSVVELLTLTPRAWDEEKARRIRLVTGLVADGWTDWYPVLPADREQVLAQRETLKKTRANAPRPRRRERPDLPGADWDR